MRMTGSSMKTVAQAKKQKCGWAGHQSFRFQFIVAWLGDPEWLEKSLPSNVFYLLDMGQLL